MRYLAENGYRSLSILEAINRVRASSTEHLQDEKLMAITFDDGYQTIYTEGFPVLKRYGFKATVFLASGLCGLEIRWKYHRHMGPQLKMLTWDEVNLMSSYGIDFGAHTLTHPCLTSLPLDLARKEILQSKALIERHLDKSVNVFAFPFGRTNVSLKSMVRSTFQAVCAARPGLLTADDDPHDLPRLSLGGHLAQFFPTHILLCRFPYLYVLWKRLVATPREFKEKHASES